MSSDSANSASQSAALRRHLRFGWWALLVFLTLGLVLEALHGFKVGWYLDRSNESRRLLWTLGHVHGVVLALINVAFGLTAARLPLWQPRWRNLASACLITATLLLPAGFLLAGVYAQAGDPGLGIVLVPPGGLLLFLAVLLTGIACGKNQAT